MKTTRRRRAGGKKRGTVPTGSKGSGLEPAEPVQDPGKRKAASWTTARSKGAPGTEKIVCFGVVCPVRYFGQLQLDD